MLADCQMLRTDALPLSLNCSGGLDQRLQAHKSFSGRLHAACQPDELEASLHDVVGAPVARNNMYRLPSPDRLSLSAPGELVNVALKVPSLILWEGWAFFTASKAAVAATSG